LIRSLRRILGPKRVFALGLILGLGLFFWPARALRSDNFVFYFPSSRHIVASEEIGQAQYLPLMPVLNVIGKVGALQEKRNSLTVWFGTSEIVLRVGEKAIQVGETRLNLAQPVRILNGQWMVPVDFVTSALPHLTREPIEYQAGASRVFIGDVRPASFSVRLDPVPNGARVTVQFTDKVNLTTAASNGKWYLFLGDRPVEPLESSFRFSDSYVNGIQFDDQDGRPKLVITPASSGLNFYPTVAEGGKVVVADILKPPPGEPQQAAAPQPAETGAAPAGETPSMPGGEEMPAGPAGLVLPVVVLDAGHGGFNLGARSRDAVLEKNLVAQLAARVRLAVLATGKYRVVLTRVGDVNMGFDERAVAANLARPVAFLTFHAGNLGIASPRVVVYSYLPPSPPLAPDEIPSALFVPWAKAQLAHLGRSRELALALHQQFAQIPGITADQPADAPVRILRSVNAPAVAIEIGSLSVDEDSAVLTTPVFQNQVAAAIVNALEAFRGGHT
jgi:N-acetylmuramoyl-L-alanine amidase